MSHSPHPGSDPHRLYRGGGYQFTLVLEGDVEVQADALRLAGLYDAVEDRATGTWRCFFERDGRNRDDAVEDARREIEAVEGVVVVRVLDF